MKKKLWKKAAYLISAVLLFAGGATALNTNRKEAGSVGTRAGAENTATAENSEAPSEAEIHFIDIGQGDATLIKCGGQTMLIDAGDNDKGTQVQLYLEKQGVDRLDYLVLTHPDADHIGGADVIITKFDIDSVFMSDYEKDSKTYRDVIQALDYKHLTWSVPEPGESYPLGTGTITFLAPNDSYSDPNNASVALMFQNGENRFLFTGDAQEEAEEDILAAGMSVAADVYKAGHHGSDTSSCQDFLDAVRPTYAVISCGEGNSYGHPHSAVLNSLRSMGVKLFRTDEQGSIVAVSDGVNITWNCAPTETWQAGDRTLSAGSEKFRISDSKADTGNRAGSGGKADAGNEAPESEAVFYIGNRKNGKLHRSDCANLPDEENRVVFSTKEEAAAAGYDDFCGSCEP